MFGEIFTATFWGLSSLRIPLAMGSSRCRRCHGRCRPIRRDTLRGVLRDRRPVRQRLCCIRAGSVCGLGPRPVLDREHVQVVELLHRVPAATNAQSLVVDRDGLVARARVGRGRCAVSAAVKAAPPQATIRIWSTAAPAPRPRSVASATWGVALRGDREAASAMAAAGAWEGEVRSQPAHEEQVGLDGGEVASREEQP